VAAVAVGGQHFLDELLARRADPYGFVEVDLADPGLLR